MMLTRHETFLQISMERRKVVAWVVPPGHLIRAHLRRNKASPCGKPRCGHTVIIRESGAGWPDCVSIKEPAQTRRVARQNSGRHEQSHAARRYR